MLCTSGDINPTASLYKLKAKEFSYTKTIMQDPKTIFFLLPIQIFSDQNNHLFLMFYTFIVFRFLKSSLKGGNWSSINGRVMCKNH